MSSILRVILAARVDIADQQRDRRAGGLALEHAGEDFDRIVFAPLRDMARRAGLATVEIELDIGFRQCEPGGQPSTTQPMAGRGLSPNVVTAEKFAESAAGHDIPDQRPVAERKFIMGETDVRVTQIEVQTTDDQTILMH